MYGKFYRFYSIFSQFFSGLEKLLRGGKINPYSTIYLLYIVVPKFYMWLGFWARGNVVVTPDLPLRSVVSICEIR